MINANANNAPNDPGHKCGVSSGKSTAKGTFSFIPSEARSTMYYLRNEQAISVSERSRKQLTRFSRNLSFILFGAGANDRLRS